MTTARSTVGFRLSYDTKTLLLALAAGLPALIVALALIWTGDVGTRVQWTLSVGITAGWVVAGFIARDQIVRPLHTVANMLSALHEGDYSIRARPAREDDAIGLIIQEVNDLGETLRKQRLDAVEATALLSKVMQEIEVAVFAFDGDRTLKLVNRGGKKLLGREDDLLGKSAAELGLSICLDGGAHRVMDTSFGGQMGRWELRRSSFREGGLPHQLIVLSDLTRALRQEERQAWQRLVQVLRHEINNSLAPIQSLAGTLKRILTRKPRPSDWEDDLERGLSIIADRSSALGRFMASYTRLTRLPAPRIAPLEIGPLVRRVAALDTRLDVQVVEGPPIRLGADGDQLEQLLINLVRNAVDAALETGGGVRVGWEQAETDDDHLDVWIEDDGPGISNTENLFVPFFTTKPRGSGIGLVLSRQIAEAHGGTLTLENRTGTRGCEAHLRLPLKAA